MLTNDALESQQLDIQSDADVVRARQAVRALAIKAQLSIVEQTKIVTAASELARNTLIHGGGGSTQLEIVHDGKRAGVRATFSDQGPGIPNMELAFSGGYTTAGGLGLGLSGSRRLVDDFEITSEAGIGTRIVVTKWKR